jgi:hypothetical protein
MSEVEGEVMWHRATSTPTTTRTLTVEAITRFGGVYQVMWHDTGKKRKILVVIDRWTTADQTVQEAVAEGYPPSDRPNVVVPMNAWR